jgi:hypothetical protein
VPICRIRGFLLYVHVNSPSAECQLPTTAQLSHSRFSTLCSREQSVGRMSTADQSLTVRRARELFSFQKWPQHSDHELRIMWAHSDLDYDDGLVLFAIARQDSDLGSGSWKRYHKAQDERLGVSPNFWIPSLNGGVYQCSLCYDSKRDPPYLYPSNSLSAALARLNKPRAKRSTDSRCDVRDAEEEASGSAKRARVIPKHLT